MLKFWGEVELELKDMRTGKIKYQTTRRNLITSTGAIELAKIVTSATSGTRPTSMGIGTSTTAPASSQSALVAQTVRRAATPTRSLNQISYAATFGTGVGTGTIQEGGLFNATTAGVMFARFLTGTFSKAAADSLTMTWRLTFGTA